MGKIFEHRSELVNLMRKQLVANDRQAIKALMRLYTYQTATEQECKNTHITNVRGFNKPDAHKMTSLAEFYKKCGFLTPKQMNLLKSKIGKYAGQMVEIALERGLIAKIGNKYAYGDEVGKAKMEKAKEDKKRQIIAEATRGF